MSNKSNVVGSVHGCPFSNCAFTMSWATLHCVKFVVLNGDHDAQPKQLWPLMGCMRCATAIWLCIVQIASLLLVRDLNMERQHAGRRKIDVEIKGYVSKSFSQHCRRHLKQILCGLQKNKRLPSTDQPESRGMWNISASMLFAYVLKILFKWMQILKYSCESCCCIDLGLTKGTISSYCIMYSWRSLPVVTAATGLNDLKKLDWMWRWRDLTETVSHKS